jgi:hypothetical protein
VAPKPTTKAKTANAVAIQNSIESSGTLEESMTGTPGEVNYLDFPWPQARAWCRVY